LPVFPLLGRRYALVVAAPFSRPTHRTHHLLSLGPAIGCLRPRPFESWPGCPPADRSTPERHLGKSGNTKIDHCKQVP
jgi:hypothetical protein